MKRLLLITTSLLLVLPDIAMAAQQAQVRPAPTKQARPTKPARPPVARPKPKPPVARPQPKPVRPTRPGAGGPQIQPPRPNPGTRPPPRPNPGTKPPRPTRPHPGTRPPRPNPGNGHRPNRPIHRPGVRPPHFKPIHRPGWHYPRGYAYRRWAIGLILPHLFLNQSYYYNDYNALGVGPPPYGYRWVRYGPDLLLVQRSTGRIADVIYGAFY